MRRITSVRVPKRVSQNGPVWRPYLVTPFLWDQGNGQVDQVIEQDAYVFVYFFFLFISTFDLVDQASIVLKFV